VTRTSTAFAVGDRIGEVHAGADCSEVVEREWSELIAQRVAQDLPRVFSEQLALAHYAATGEQRQAKSVEVSAFVNDMAVKVCRVGQATWQGGIYVQVSWQVLSPESGRVLYQASSEGSYLVSEPRRASAAAGFREALGVSVRNLLADSRFAAMLQQRNADGRVAATGRWY
jgi:serine protease Do